MTIRAIGPLLCGGVLVLAATTATHAKDVKTHDPNIAISSFKNGEHMGIKQQAVGKGTTLAPKAPSSNPSSPASSGLGTSSVIIPTQRR